MLERRLSFPFGLGMRIRRIPESALVPGATVDGEALIEAYLRHQIDNMEGLAARRNARAERNSWPLILRNVDTSRPCSASSLSTASDIA